MITMLTVLCVKFGNKYGDNYVEKLRNMVSRHLTLPYEFVCLTDSKHPIEDVRSIVIPNQGYTKQWWHKIHMFDPTLPVSGRIIYFDLDVVIHSNINKLVENYATEFLGIRDFNRKFIPNWDKLNSSVMSWESGKLSDIFTTFKSDMQRCQRLHGDQDWIYQIAKERLTYWPDKWIMSYKWEIRNRNEILALNGKRNFKTIANPVIPKDCCVTVFHGDPNPDCIQDPYVVDNWR
jgi:hypothetical protein